LRAARQLYPRAARPRRIGVFRRICDEFIDQKRRGDCAVCGDLNPILRADSDLAAWHRFFKIVADIAEIGAEIQDIQLLAA
jgi:hypothetical protein